MTSTHSSLTLEFLDGRYAGQALQLPRQPHITVGRSPECDIVLIDALVSRQHARLQWRGDSLLLLDDDSVNGTVVNGVSITTPVALYPGDVLDIGDSRLRIVAPEMRSRRDTRAKGEVEALPTGVMSGSLSDVAAVEVLQLLSANRKTGTLVLRGDVEGVVCLHKGRLVDARLDDSPTVSAHKAFLRLAAIQRGAFSLLATPGDELPAVLDENVEVMLMEAMRQLDEINHLGSQLPQIGELVTVRRPFPGVLGELERRQLDVLQLVWNHASVRAVLDHSHMSDLETLQILASLVRLGFVSVLP